MKNASEVVRRLINYDNELREVYRYASLEHFVEAVLDKLPNWENEATSGPYGLWETNIKDLIVTTLQNETKLLDACKLSTDNPYWQHFPTELLKAFPFPDLEIGTVPSNNFMLRQHPHIECIEGGKIYIEGHVADKALKEILKKAKIDDADSPLPRVGRPPKKAIYVQLFYEHFSNGRQRSEDGTMQPAWKEAAKTIEKDFKLIFGKHATPSQHTLADAVREHEIQNESGESKQEKLQSTQ